MLWKWIESDLHGGHLGSWGKVDVYLEVVCFFKAHILVSYIV